MQDTNEVDNGRLAKVSLLVVVNQKTKALELRTVTAWLYNGLALHRTFREVDGAIVQSPLGWSISQNYTGYLIWDLYPDRSRANIKHIFCKLATMEIDGRALGEFSVPEARKISKKHRRQMRAILSSTDE